MSLEELKRKRAIIKGQLTRGCNFIFEAPTDDPCFKELIEERVEKLGEHFKEFNDVQFWIESLITNEDELKAESEGQRVDIEQKYYSARAKGRFLLKGFTENGKSNTSTEAGVQESSIDKINSALGVLIDQQAILGELVSRSAQSALQFSPQTIPTPSNTVNSQSDIHSNQISPDIKLSPIKLPTFDGKFKNWPSFNDMYVSLIHNNPKLTKTQKFYYLKSSLSHEPAAVINSFDITEANYTPAYDQLVATYNKENLIIEEHLKIIMDQPVISHVSEDGLRVLKSSVSDSVAALKALKIPTDQWDCWLVYVVCSKLDRSSHQLWRREIATKNKPTFQELLEFIDRRIYEVCTSSSPNLQRHSGQRSNLTNKARCLVISSSACVFCHENHQLAKCSGFGKLSVNRKRDFVAENKLCFNCLKKGHLSKFCTSFLCQICNRKHHTILHENYSANESSGSASKIETKTVVREGSSSSNDKGMSVLTTIQNCISFASILPTALVYVADSSGCWQRCRVLLDSGSQVSLITEACAQRLKLPRTQARIAINGVGTEVSSYTKGAVSLRIRSRKHNEELKVAAYVLREIVSNLSSSTIGHDCKQMIQGLELADPSFETAGKIDILLGCDVFFRIMGNQKIESVSRSSIALETIFGWVISGNIEDDSKNKGSERMFILTTHVDINETIKKFWEVETIKDTKMCTEEEQSCEDHFVKTHRRLSNGRYVVRLPFKTNIECLGNSKNMASRRFGMLERRFEHNASLREEYSSFIQEYLSLGHMAEIDKRDRELIENKTFYMPHHAVFKLDSTTTKLRVVFDASAVSTSGQSLNSLLLNGPKIQADLFEILSRFRMHRIGYTADIAKMYRQVLIHPDDANFQRIFWRQSKQEQLREYKLKTVTYGTTSAPFLAIRCLKQLALDEMSRHPLGAENLLKNFYVDDFMGGCDTVEEAVKIKNDLCEILTKGEFDLRKWSSNSAEFLAHIPTNSLETLTLSLSEDKAVKTLGLYWSSVGDFFFFKVSLGELEKVTKRAVLSEISKIFDPFGWISPSIITAKVIIQDMWISGVAWDDELPSSILQKWLNLRQSLKCLENITIPRWIRTENASGQQRVLHGFSDASERAYAACLYMSVYTEGNWHSSLLASKTKVAPVNRISIPKLELCGAYLLAKLMEAVKKSMGLFDIPCYAWTDSQVVLAWLSQHPSKWKTFVGNRTSEILEIIPRSQWRHVASKVNPADCASRGLQPNQLLTFDLWWKGPEFFRDDYTLKTILYCEIPETDLEKRNCTVAAVEVPVQNSFLLRFSSLTKLNRISAWCRRFINNAKTEKGNRVYGLLSVRELEAELIFWIKDTQSQAFSLELQRLRQSRAIRRDSHLKSLNPFIGNDGLLRVGGRIEKGTFCYDQKHPPILSKESHLTSLIIDYYHHKYLHAGPQLMLGVLRQHYWILNLKRIVNKFIRTCVRCQRYKARPLDQQMGNVPAVRLEMSKPFTNTGIDYAGPLSIQSRKGRGAQHTKCYVALFICLSTRAIHLELVSDLTSAAAIAALKRFLARRGAVKKILSDNGLNFVGASRELKGLYNLLKTSENVQNYLLEEKISWEFIPSHAPHFGGIWEAGVKSTKYHLRRVVGQTSLTFEELSTLLCQIEICLNSRPLASLTNDTLEPLTPNLILTGGPTMTLPEENLTNAKENTLSRWQYTQRLQQEFWRRWQREYVHQLQQRSKWTLKKRNMVLNDLVLVVDNNLPPGKWLMGRIIKLFPGADDLVRVVEIRTKSGVLRRDITKLALLLPNED